MDDLKAGVKAAEIAIKKDDEEWREDYNKISDENKSLTEEIDNSLKLENDKLHIDSLSFIDTTVSPQCSTYMGIIRTYM